MSLFKNKIEPTTILKTEAIKTQPAAISFDISTSFEYLFLYVASKTNSITELNNSQINTAPITIKSKQNSIWLNFKTKAKIIAKIPTKD